MARSNSDPSAPSAMSYVGPSPGALLQLIREGHGETRGDLTSITGLGRATVSQRIDSLLAAGFLRAPDQGTSTGGRPPQTFAFNSGGGRVCVADLGVMRSRLAVTDMDGRFIAER